MRGMTSTPIARAACRTLLLLALALGGAARPARAQSFVEYPAHPATYGDHTIAATWAGGPTSVTLQFFSDEAILHADGNGQSQRTARYQAALDRLQTAGWTYACGCSRREIADSAFSGADGPIYPGTCRNKRLATTGNAVRIRTRPGITQFNDRVQGIVSQRIAEDIGDFVLRRRDHLFAYQLAVVVDDADQGVTDVVRGADLLDSTPRQIFLQHVLGVPEPSYLHIPVAVNAAGQKLSKQTLAPAVDDEAGCGVLNRALQFLGQPVISATQAQQPAALLEIAVSQWNPATIPRSRFCHIP